MEVRGSAPKVTPQAAGPERGGASRQPASGAETRPLSVSVVSLVGPRVASGRGARGAGT